MCVNCSNETLYFPSYFKYYGIFRLEILGKYTEGKSPVLRNVVMVMDVMETWVTKEDTSVSKTKVNVRFKRAHTTPARVNSFA